MEAPARTGQQERLGTTETVAAEHLPVDVRASLRLFTFYLANGKLELDLLDGSDYRPGLMAFGSTLEQVFAIYTNVLRVSENGRGRERRRRRAPCSAVRPCSL